ncbi:MAG: PilT/PilU family type 4a pilus ATPase [Polyangiaceae bacterium]|nr:PilT/PilU family type 4a pilus ATPase [Polyangiaceae bacterium]
MLDLKALFRELHPGSTKKIELTSGRRPRLVDGNQVKNLGDEILNDEEVLDLCRAHGGGKELDELDDKPIRWVTPGPKGQVSVTVAMKGREVAATFAPAPEPRRSTRPPRRQTASAMRRAEPDTHRTEHRRAITAAERRRVSAKPPPPAERPRSPTPAATKRRTIPAQPAARAPQQAQQAQQPQQARPAEPAFEQKRDARGGPAPVNWIRELCESAARQGASDVHLTTGMPLAVRIAGELREAKNRVGATDLENTLKAILTPQARAELERNGGTCFALALGSNLRARVNVTQTHAGLKLALRLVKPEPASLADLGLPAAVAQIIEQPQGLCLVVGPAGQGKTTTLASLVDQVNQTRAAHIVVVEDPIEIPITSKKAVVSQREVGTDASSFHRALEGALRQDPDVIAIGELRDIETVRMALAASETGHLVIGTMNAPDARRAIERIIEVFPTGEQPQVRTTLAGGLRLVIGQRLLRKEGTSERVAAVEILPGSVALWNLIREDKTFQIPSLMQRGKALGIVRLEDSVRELRDNGVISKADAEPFLTKNIAAEAPVLEAPAPDRGAQPEPLPADDSALGALWNRAGAIFGRKGGPQ